MSESKQAGAHETEKAPDHSDEAKDRLQAEIAASVRDCNEYMRRYDVATRSRDHALVTYRAAFAKLRELRKQAEEMNNKVTFQVRYGVPINMTNVLATIAHWAAWRDYFKYGQPAPEKPVLDSRGNDALEGLTAEQRDEWLTMRIEHLLKVHKLAYNEVMPAGKKNKNDINYDGFAEDWIGRKMREKVSEHLRKYPTFKRADEYIAEMKSLPAKYQRYEAYQPISAWSKSRRKSESFSRLSEYGNG